TPHAPGPTLPARLRGLLTTTIRHPVRTLRAFFVPDLARHSMIVLYMRTLEGKLSLRLGRSLRTLFRRGVVTEVQTGEAPTAAIPEATDLAERIAEKIDGFPVSLITE
ncbi:MAG: GMC family oxidoreductase, partial [Gammaproteobacteria bacterium]|nr:GMC family oxidoreductase [Gemmatimonadota bacterium]NIU79305.1 GMC family oxidoreductase [Gammaproteobacteria bacterium]